MTPRADKVAIHESSFPSRNRREAKILQSTGYSETDTINSIGAFEALPVHVTTRFCLFFGGGPALSRRSGVVKWWKMPMLEEPHQKA